MLALLVSMAWIWLLHTHTTRVDEAELARLTVAREQLVIARRQADATFFIACELVCMVILLVLVVLVHVLLYNVNVRARHQ